LWAVSEEYKFSLPSIYLLILIGDKNTKVWCSDKQENLKEDFAFCGFESGTLLQLLSKLAA
jgi:hypothetical protein